MLMEMKKFGPSLDGGPKAEIPLHEGGVSRKRNDSIGREVMRVEAKEIKELAEKVGGREAESPFKVRQEDDPFAGFGGRDEFCPGLAANHLRRDSA